MDLAETLRGFLGRSSGEPAYTPPNEDYAAGIRPMVDPLAGKRSVGEMPSTQNALKTMGREAVEPFKQVGRAISGRSDNPVPEGLLGGLGVAMAIPGGIAKGALKAGAKLGGEALEDIIAPTAKKAATGGVEDMIRAYHGSPHDFERFDLSKIGTGEGAQAYGHGLYFAENEGVAKGYRDALSRDVFTVNGKPMDMPGLRPELRQAVKAVDEYGGADKAKAHFSQIPGSEVPQWIDKAQEAGLGLHKGHTYEVGIRANPEHFLDWDKPLSEQHPHVQEKIAGEFGKSVTRLANEVHEGLDGRWYTLQNGEAVGNTRGFPDKATADYALKVLQEQKLPSKTVGEWLSSSPGAEHRMREAGIPGIKYLDQGSRGVPTSNGRVQYLNGKYHIVDDWGTQAGPFDTKEEATQYLKTPKQTHNFVVFDDKLIDILKKYGIAGIGALPAMNAYHYQDDKK